MEKSRWSLVEEGKLILEHLSYYRNGFLLFIDSVNNAEYPEDQQHEPYIGKETKRRNNAHRYGKDDIDDHRQDEKAQALF